MILMAWAAVMFANVRSGIVERAGERTRKIVGGTLSTVNVSHASDCVFTQSFRRLAPRLIHQNIPAKAV
jgi:hypothetical protein